MFYRLQRPEEWVGVAIEEPHSVIGSHPELVFYEVRDHDLYRMSLNLESALAEYRYAPSCVPCRSVRDVAEWLTGCEYMSDRDQFDAPDVWMHPADFELTRRGDCDDHALWAYSRLAQLGHEVRYVVGHGPSGGGHAWVTLRASDGAWILMETTAKDPLDLSLTPHEDAGSYRPAWSVDQSHAYHRYPANLSWVSPGVASSAARGTASRVDQAAR